MDKDNECSYWFMHVFPKLIGRDVQVRMPCRVNRYNKSNHTVTAIPLPLDSQGNKRAPILAIVPYSIWMLDKVMKPLTRKHRQYSVTGGKGTVKIEDLPKWKPLKHGSIVSVGTFDRDTDNMHGNNNYKLKSNRMHSFNDAIVTEVIKP